MQCWRETWKVSFFPPHVCLCVRRDVQSVSELHEPGMCLCLCVDVCISVSAKTFVFCPSHGEHAEG